MSSEPFRRQWVLVVADEGTCERAATAKWALESALRTWLSLVTPPDAERICDYLRLTLLTMVHAAQTRRATPTISPVYPAE
ncbi:MAG: hypothetical protein JSU86_13055 [Phycisphaerales bacterium]|nr:MAG: hypothetical protein JSU86_13055 [Phycisphaerales bacterium]